MHSLALAARTRTRAVSRAKRDRRWAAVSMVLPASILLVCLIIVPLIAVVVIAFTNWQMGSSRIAFVGLSNFVELLSDRQFQTALLNTLIYVATVAPLTVGIGLAVALLIAGSRIGQNFYRTIYFLPTIATLAAAAVAWQMLLHPTSGLFNQMLRAIDVSGPNWLKDSNWALPTLAMIGVWERVGFNTIFYMAALRDVPQSLMDAARIDGAGGSWDRFWLVVWPQLGPMTLFLVITAGIHAFQAFETVAILTQGGPQKATQLLLYTIYQEGFVFFRTSYAATVTVAFLLILLVFSATQFRYVSRRVHYT
ncbi:MAG: sugar ABC transporter permease [Bradyrhizobium sp.]